jgi:hypothetical protein
MFDRAAGDLRYHLVNKAPFLALAAAQSTWTLRGVFFAETPTPGDLTKVICGGHVLRQISVVPGMSLTVAQGAGTIAF